MHRSKKCSAASATKLTCCYGSAVAPVNALAERCTTMSRHHHPNIWESLIPQIDPELSPANPDNALANSPKMFRTIRY
jgi:hypothetical protein